MKYCPNSQKCLTYKYSSYSKQQSNWQQSNRLTETYNCEVSGKTSDKTMFISICDGVFWVVFPLIDIFQTHCPCPNRIRSNSSLSSLKPENRALLVVFFSAPSYSHLFEQFPIFLHFYHITHSSYSASSHHKL